MSAMPASKLYTKKKESSWSLYLWIRFLIKSLLHYKADHDTSVTTYSAISECDPKRDFIKLNNVKFLS